MHLKTFHAPSIQDAIRQARQQLGPDAMLLNSRRVSTASDPVAVFAVTFATTSPIAAADTAETVVPANVPVPRQANAEVSSSPTADGTGTESAHPALSTASKLSSQPVRVDGAARSSEAVQSDDAPRGQTRRNAKESRGSSKERSAKTSASPSPRGTKPARVAASDEAVQCGTRQNAGSKNRGERERGAGSGPEPDGLQAHSDLLDRPYPSYEKLFEQMTSMRREMLQLAGSVRRASAVNYRQELASEELKWAYDVLVSQDFSSELIEDVMEDLTLRLTAVPERGVKARRDRRRHKEANAVDSTTEDGLLALLRESLGSRIELRPEPSLHRRTGKPHIIALVGPPGVGKTTTLVKLAGRFGLHSRFPLQIISMDNYRVAAAEQLRTYASVLGVGFDALPSAGALDKALRQYEAKDLILIDTPGYGWQDFSAAEDLASLLREQESASIHLSLSASMKPADLSRVADLYEVFAYNSMLFTKLDETSTIGCLVSEAWTRRKPLSYLCAGQRIPDDIDVASHEQILQRMLPMSLNADEFAA